VTMIVEGD